MAGLNTITTVLANPDGHLFSGTPPCAPARGLPLRADRGRALYSQWPLEGR